MFDLSASVAVDFLPMVAEETKLRGVALSEEVVLDGVDPACVGVLIFVDQYDRIFVRQDAPEFGVVHESDGQEEDIVVMDGDATVVDASVPKLVLNGTLPEVADFGDSLRPMLELRQSFPKLSLEAADERPAERVDRIGIDERASVGPGVDFVLRHVGKGDARDLLMPLRQNVPVAVHEEMKRLDERVGLSGAGTGFDEEALLALQAAIHFGEGSLAGLLGRVQVFHNLNHREHPPVRGHRRQVRLGQSPPRHPECRRAPAISIRRGCSRVRPSQFRR